MGKFHHMIISIVFFVTIALLSDEVHSSPVVIRVPRSIGGIIRRLISGRRKQTGFQGTSAVQQPYAYGSYGQASSLYPSYSPYSSIYPGYSPYYPSGYSGGYSPSAYQSAYGSYSPAALAAAATSQYPAYSAPSAYASPSSYSSPSSYASPSTYGAAASSAGSLDLHQVLDQLVRSAGLSPSGEHDPQATLQSKGDSSFAQSGTTPVFSFKKLYSFPFYVSSADQSAESSYNVPFMKRHIKRMSPEVQQQQQQQQIQQIQQMQLLKQIEPLITMRMAQIQDQKKEQQQSSAQQHSQPQSVSQSVQKSNHQEYSSAQDVDQPIQ